MFQAVLSRKGETGDIVGANFWRYRLCRIEALSRAGTNVDVVILFPHAGCFDVAARQMTRHRKQTVTAGAATVISTIVSAS